MRKSLHILAVFLLGLALSGSGSGPNLGRPPTARADTQENLRESCRRLIGGRYISIYDDALQSRRYVQVLTNQQKQLATALQKEKKKLATLEAAASVGEFDGAKATARDIQAGAVNNIEEQIRMNTPQIEKAERTAKVKADEEVRLKRRLAPVFKIAEILSEKNQKGYSFRVEFNSTCPRFQYQCPLPEDHSKALVKILPEDTLPIECQRYASIGRAQDRN